MQTVTIKDLRNNLAQYIDEVAIAKSMIEITKFGKPKARIIPVIAEKNSAKNMGILSSFGAWKSRKNIKNSAQWVDKLRKRTSSRYGNIFG